MSRPVITVSTAIVPVDTSKPHLVKVGGYWRMSPAPPGALMNPPLLKRFVAAMRYAEEKNHAILFEEVYQ